VHAVVVVLGGHDGHDLALQGREVRKVGSGGGRRGTASIVVVGRASSSSTAGNLGIRKKRERCRR
jgi:hypothetical protein